MTIVVHLTEASRDGVTPHGEHVYLLRHPFAAAISADGLAAVLEALDGLGSTDDLLMFHPNVELASVDRLTALLRRSQRLRSVAAVGHGLGPLGADLLVESLAILLSNPTVGLDGAASWCGRCEAMITDVVWTSRPSARWARLDLRDRLLARLSSRRVRIQLRPERHASVATKREMLTGLEMTMRDADVAVGGRDAGEIARAIEQLGGAQARSVRIVESGTGSPVVAEVVISSSLAARGVMASVP